MIPYDEFLASEIYKQYFTHFEIEHGICLIGPVPFHINQYMIFYLFNSDSSHFFTEKQTNFIDALAPTMIASWLYQTDFFDECYMKNCSLLLSKFDNAPEQLKLFKLVVNYPEITSQEYANILNIESKKTVDKRLAEIFNKFKISGYGKNKQTKLVKMFPFLTKFSLPLDNQIS